MDTEQTRALVQKYYDTLPKGDRAAIAELLTDNCEWVPPETADFDTVRGRDAVAEQFSGALVKSTFDLSKPFRVEVRKMIVEGDTAVVQQRLTATAKNGNDYDNQYCWVYECRDGQIARIEEYVDTLLASRVMGWDESV